MNVRPPFKECVIAGRIIRSATYELKRKGGGIPFKQENAQEKLATIVYIHEPRRWDAFVALSTVTEPF